MGPTQRSQWHESTIAIVIAALLTLAWSVAEWARLSALILPDPDDMMRLVQIRDWIDGQPFFDLTQYRLGNGLAMHWSRLPDMVPAALIVMLEPLAGRDGAEIAAVIAWPAILFAATLALLGDAARRLSHNRSAGVIAILLGAIAYPATGFFTPGRIDHHGLQLVLLLVAARAMLLPPTSRGGLAVGVSIAASLAIGLETAPLCALVIAALALRWAIEGGTRRAMLLAGGVGLAGGVLTASLLLRPAIWRAELCDAFTPPVAWLAVLAGMLLTMVGLAGTRLHSVPARLALLGGAGVVILAATPWLAPACLGGPYGAIPPLLRALWLDQVAEAQPLFVMPIGVVFAYAGLMIVGTVTGALHVSRSGGPAERLTWLALQAGALLLSCIQLRLAPFGAALAVPVMAAWVAQVRSGGRPLVVTGAWAASAGILYPLAAMLIPAKPEAPRDACLTQATLAAIAATGAKRIAVPLDMGAYVIASSGASVLAAPYHRNVEANLAHYRLFLGRPQLAAAEARRWRIDAIAYCPDWLTDLDPLRIAAPGSIIATARTGQAPGWSAATRRPGLIILAPR